MPGFGVPVQNDAQFVREDVTVSAGNAVALPASGQFSTPVSSGYVRVKFYTSNGVQDELYIYALDSNGTERQIGYAYIDSTGFDLIFPFLVDIEAVQVSAWCGFSAELDIEIAATSGDPQ